jgi:SUMO ligase MMS21 Smc5/6 complex component
VYDKAAITQALQASGGVIVCPVAGASHQVRLADLKPCKRLERAKKAAKLQNLRTMMQQQATQGGGAGASSSRQKPGS